MTKQKLKIKTCSFSRKEFEKQNRPLSGWELVKEYKNLFGKYVLIFEKTYTNG
jgi:hypothetical protein